MQEGDEITAPDKRIDGPAESMKTDYYLIHFKVFSCGIISQFFLLKQLPLATYNIKLHIPEQTEIFRN